MILRRQETDNFNIDNKNVQTIQNHPELLVHIYMNVANVP